MVCFACACVCVQTSHATNECFDNLISLGGGCRGVYLILVGVCTCGASLGAHSSKAADAYLYSVPLWFARVCLICEKLRLQERRVSRHQHQHNMRNGSTNGDAPRALTPDAPPAEKDPREVRPFTFLTQHLLEKSQNQYTVEQIATGMQTRSASKRRRLPTVPGV